MNHQRTRQRPASAPVKASKQTSTRKSRAPLDNLGSDYNQEQDKFTNSKSEVSSRNGTRFVRNDAASIMKINPAKPSNSNVIPKSTRKGRKNDNKEKSSVAPLNTVSSFESAVSISPTSSISSSGSIRTNVSSSSSLQQKISERRRELRSFIQQQREIRKSEREMKQSDEDEIEKQQIIQQEAPYMGHASVENVVENKMLEDEQMPKDSHSSLKRVHFYEGPSEMSQEDEPTYTNIRKKLTSPILKKNTKKSDETTSGIQMKQNASPNSGVSDANHTVVSSKAPENEFVTSSTLANAKGSMFSFFVAMEAPPPLPNPEDQPVQNIIIGNYAESAFLEFGDESMNLVGKSKSLPFDLTLPTDAKYKSVNLKVEKVPIKKGFSLGLVSTEENHSSRTGFVLQRGETKRMFLTWTPVEQGGVCEVVYLKLPRGRVRVTARGNARNMKTLQNQSSKTHNGKVFKANRARNIPGKTLPSTDSTLGKEKVPNPTYRNKSYDKILKVPEYSPCVKRSWDSYNEDFASQQCETFARWLNHMFQTPEMQNEGKFCGKSLRTILSRRRHVKACEKAQKLYNSTEMKRVREVIKNEVESRRLEIRLDHDVFANVSLRSQMISLLMSYSTPWLCIGLETVFGQVIDFTASNSSIDNRPQRKSDELITRTLVQKKITKRAILINFIVDRLLSDPYLKLKYTGGKCNVPSGHFERQYKNELNKHILMSTLNLIVFLDAAKQQHVIESALLFLRKSSVKSSRALLNVICRDYISGIGNLFKHLSHLQINVSYEQSPLEELKFFVSNLATDLRDGSRLGKLAELLSNRHNILEEMRLPAISRLQKVHNVSVALRHLSEVGIPNVSAIHPNYIVDGHRPQVLKMLWSIISSCQLENVIRKDKLRDEIYNIHSANEHRKEPYNFSKHCGNIETCNDVCQLLLIWCDSICGTFGYEITDFSRSFYDGVAPLLLIAFYHPSIVNFKSILPTSNYKRESLKASEKVVAIRNEHKNCHLSQEKMHSLGGIPNMFPISDMDDLPDERSVIVCIAYLCARLLESSEELNAIIIIQNSFRKHLAARQERIERGAVMKIERFWLQNKKKYFSVQRDLYSIPVKKIESFLCSHRPKLKLMQRRRQCCVKIQKLFRGYRTRCLVYQKSKESKAAIMIQAIWRRSLQCMVFTLTRKAAVHIQAIVRGVQSRKIFAQKRDNVIKIQRFLKTRLAEKYRRVFIREVVTCQGIVRRRHAQNRVKHMKDESEVALCQYRCKCAIKIQAVLRRYIQIQRRENMNRAATLIQRCFRAWIAKNDSISFYSCNTSCISENYSSDGQLHEISSVSMYPKGTSFKQEKDNLTNDVALPERSPQMNGPSERHLHMTVDTKFSGSLYNNSFTDENDMNLSQKESVEKSRYFIVNKHGFGQKSTSAKPLLVDSDLVMACDQDPSSGVPLGSDSLDTNSTKYLLPRHCVDDKSAMTGRHQVSHNQPNEIYECSSMKEAKSSSRLPDSTATEGSEKISQKNFSQNESIHSNSNNDPNVKDEVIDSHSASSPTRDAILSLSYSCTSNPRESILVERCIKHRVEGNAVKHLPNDYHGLQEKAATKIQSHWRKFYAFVQYQFDLSDIVFIQSLVRKRIAQKLMRKRYMSITLIQSKVKIWLERRIMIRNTSATMIQKYWRRYTVNMDYKVLVHATLVIQQAVRSRLKQVRRGDVVKAASQIQRIWRGYSKYLEFNMSVAAATTIQRNYRAYRLKVIQDFPDIICQSKDIDPMQNEVTSDYQGSRRTVGVTTKKDGNPFTNRSRDDVKSHSFQQIKTVSRIELRNCAKLEPFAVQTGLEVAGHIIKKSGIRRDIFPTHLEKNYEAINSNGEKTTVSINTSSENNKKQAARKSFKTPHPKGDKQILTFTDGIRMDVDAENDSCNKMNAVFVGGSPDITSRVLSNPRNDKHPHTNTVCFMSEDSFSKVENLQLNMISQKVRSCMPKEHNLIKKDSLQKKKLWKSSADVKGSSEEMIVVQHLKTMKKSEKLRDVIQAAKSLEIWTKSSYNSCKMLITSESVEVLYSLIRACNRSVPHVELLEYILETLFHVTKYEDLIPSICSESLVETLVDLIQLFRDKDDIFCYAAIILKRIVLTGKDALIVCRKPDNLNRLLGIYQIRGFLPDQDTIPEFDGKKRPFLTMEKSGLKNLEVVIKACNEKEKNKHI